MRLQNDIAKTFGATVVLNELAGRARQMNNGPTQATGDVLYFFFADSIPPATFLQQIGQKIAEGYDELPPL